LIAAELDGLSKTEQDGQKSYFASADIYKGNEQSEITAQKIDEFVDSIDTSFVDIDLTVDNEEILSGSDLEDVDGAKNDDGNSAIDSNSAADESSLNSIAPGFFSAGSTDELDPLYGEADLTFKTGVSADIEESAFSDEELVDSDAGLADSKEPVSEDSELPTVGELLDIGEIEELSSADSDSNLSVTEDDLTQDSLSSALVREDHKTGTVHSTPQAPDNASSVEVHNATGLAKVRMTVRRWTGRAISWLKRFVGF